MLKMEVAAEKLLEMKVEAAVKARWGKLGVGTGGSLWDSDDEGDDGGGLVGMEGGLGVGREGGDRLWVGGEVGCDVLEGGREGGCGLEVGSG